MSGLRALLRLDDKVAAEGRRIQRLGGPALKWVAPAALLFALSLHAAVLLLPAAHHERRPPAASPAPDFPLVWRAPAPVLPPAEPQPEKPEAKAAPAMPEPEPERTAETGVARALMTEPVPEPAPELVLNMIPADVDAIIPKPDRPPPAPELGPPSRVPAPPPAETPPSLVLRVPPVYPAAARSLRAEGRVTLRLAVLPDGTVGGATVVACSRPGLGFEAAALEAVKQWRYQPAPPQAGSRKVVVSIHFQHDVRP